MISLFETDHNLPMRLQKTNKLTKKKKRKKKK